MSGPAPASGDAQALRDGVGILSSNALNNLVAFAAMAVAALRLPVAAFGATGLAIATVVLAAGLADCGTSVALVRVLGRDAAARAAAVPAALAWKLGASALLAALALAAPWPALQPMAAHAGLLPATLVAAALLGAWTTLRAHDQAREDFAALRRLTLSYAAARAAAFLALLALDAVTPLGVVLSLYAVPLALLLALRAARGGLRLPPWPALRMSLHALLAYGAWVGLSALCFNALARTPLFVLGILGEPLELARLAAALTFAGACAMLGDALRTVTLPRLVRAADAGRRRAERAQLRRQLAAPLALALAAMTAGAFAYARLLGPAYANLEPTLLALGVATLLTAALGLPNALLHAHGRPALDAAVNVARLVVLGVALHLAPASALAFACAYGATLVIGELVLYVLVASLDRKPRAAAVLAGPLGGAQP